MDFSTMRKKVENNQYSSLDGFEEDFYHVWHNATIYNQADTIYCKAALRIRDAGTVSIMHVAMCVQYRRFRGISKLSL